MGLDAVRELSIATSSKVFNTGGYGLTGADKKLVKLEPPERWAKFMAFAKKQKVENLGVNGGEAKTVAGYLGALKPTWARLDCVCIGGLIDALPAAAAKKLLGLDLVNLDADDVPAPLGKLSSLTRLSLEAFDLTPLLARALAKPPATLTELSLKSTQPLDLSKVKLPETLERLELSSQRGITLPAKLPALARLSLFTAGGDVGGLDGIAKLGSLEELDVHTANVQRVPLKGLGKLRSLRLATASGVGVGTLTELEELMVLLAPDERFALADLEGLDKLRDLYLSGQPKKPDLSPLAALPALKVLRLNEFTPGSAQLAPLAGRGIELRDSTVGSGPVEDVIAALKKKKR